MLQVLAPEQSLEVLTVGRFKKNRFFLPKYFVEVIPIQAFDELGARTKFIPGVTKGVRGPVIAHVITDAARRVNHRSLGRRDKPDEEARRPSIFLKVTLVSSGGGPFSDARPEKIFRFSLPSACGNRPLNRLRFCDEAILAHQDPRAICYALRMAVFVTSTTTWTRL